MKYKVKIKKCPTMAYGGQKNFALDTKPDFTGTGSTQIAPGEDVRTTIQPVPREEANIEAEKNETLLMPTQEGIQHFNIGGKPHSQGGTPLNVPEGSFVFSNTKRLKIGGPVLEMFGKSPDTKQKFTPAQLAKQYQMNPYQAVLNNPDSDSIEKNTATLMIKNNGDKLAQLALVQESKKGFPQGIPAISQQYMAGKNQQPATPDTLMRYGGLVKAKNGLSWNYNPTVPEQMFTAPGTYPIPSWYKYWNKANTYEGGHSATTGKPTTYDPSVGNHVYDDYNYWRDLHGKEFSSPDQYQSFVFNTLQQRNPQAVGKIMSEYGMPKAGRLDDSIFGARTAEASGFRPGEIPSPVEPTPNFTATIPNTPQGINGPHPGQYVPANVHNTYGWLTPDKVDMANSLYNLSGIKKETPWAPSVQFSNPEYTYTDPGRALSANNEQASSAEQANAILAGPGASYRNSEIQGKAAENAANIIGQYAERNTGLANQAAKERSETQNRQVMYDAERAKSLYDGNTIAEQQYQNSLRQGRDAVAKQFGQGWNDASMLYNMNIDSQHYYIDPATGKRTFKSAGDFNSWMQQQKGTGSGSNDELARLTENYYQAIKGYYPTTAAAKQAAAEAALSDVAKRDRRTTTTKTGNTTVKDTHYQD